MKGLVEVIARALVDDPAPVEVIAAGSEHEPIYRLRVGSSDLGKVIGKKGRTAKAFRTLLAVAGTKQNLKPTLEILEPERPRRTRPESDAHPGADPDDVAALPDASVVATAVDAGVLNADRDDVPSA
jgi:predicted RNA-binding protein YlqC (UPF0109 family)